MHKLEFSKSGVISFHNKHKQKPFNSKRNSSSKKQGTSKLHTSRNSIQSLEFEAILEKKTKQIVLLKNKVEELEAQLEKSNKFS